MADDTTVTPQEPVFEPEPVPDNIADTELTGLQPTEESTDSEPVEPSKDETSDDQSTDDSETEEPDTTSTEEVAEPTEEPVAPTTEQPNQEELSGVQRRLAEKAQRDYILGQRQQIRDYESQVDPTDVEERMKVLEAKQYVDTVERNRMAVTNDVTRAKTEIPFFKTATPQSEAAFDQALANYANAYGVLDPESGVWIAAQDREGNDIPLLPYLQQQATMYEQMIQTTQRTAQKAEQKMRAKAVNPSNPGKVTSSGDDLQDLLDRIGDVNLTGK